MRNTYSSELNVDLTNNSIVDFTQKSVYNMSLKWAHILFILLLFASHPFYPSSYGNTFLLLSSLASNLVCEGGATGRYCATGKTNIQSRSPSNGCDHVRCGSDKVPSPNCTCAHPYIGTITFLLHSFSNLDNTTYYKLLNDSLMSAFRSKQLPVESIFISNAFIGEYLQYTLHIFPSGQDHFNLLEVSSIGTVINRQPAELIVLPRFGPFFFLDVNYFEGDYSFQSYNLSLNLERCIQL